MKVLATSRAPLHLRAERLYPVPPLALPDPGADEDRDAVARSEAVQFFLERAQAADPSIMLIPEAVPAIADIVRRLDGLPLAIELAAARIRLLPPAALLTRLEQRLPLLTGGARDAPQRQQTLRATIAWSHDLLTPKEQVFFRRLAVFAGGFSLKAAVVVASGSVEPGIDLFEGVACLLDKSMLRQEAGPDGEPRFAMLETVREFALEQLAASGKEARIRACHAAWCLALAEEAGLDINAGRDQAAWLVRLDAELDNLRAALTWFTRAGQHANVLRMLSPIEEYWILRPYHAEVLGWLEPALRAAPDVPVAVRVAALVVAVNVSNFLGNGSAAVAYAEEALALARRQLVDPFTLGRAHWAVGLARAFSGDAVRAVTAYEAALPLLREAGEPYWLAVALAETGDALHMADDVARAVVLLDEAVEIYRGFGFPSGIVVGLGERAHAALSQGDPVLAARLFTETIVAGKAIGAERIVLGAVAGLAGVALALEQPKRAVRLLGAVEAARETSGAGRIADAPNAERIMAEARSRLSEPAFAAAWKEGRVQPLDQVVVEALTLGNELAISSPTKNQAG